MKYLKKLTGERVFLSPHNPEDYERFAEWVNDPEICISMNILPQIYSMEKEREILQKFSSTDKGYHFAIIDKETGKPIGGTALLDVDHIHRKATFGIFIGDRNYWNGGFGTEATKLVLDFGFNILNLINIDLHVIAFNARAIRCYEKCGFKQVGIRRQGYFVAGQYHDELIFDLLAEDFKDSYIKTILDKALA
ncbi:MAG TPA: GNAT family protein, partial [Candidatus Cloacimonadota bacterium]|nr:GNAT family protein [Candidatus Cloacimonadota bacterium]